MKNNSFKNYSDLLLSSGSRIPLIADWLIHSVWSEENFASKENKSYLDDGEKQVRDFEELILNTAPGVYDELTSLAKQKSNFLTNELSKQKMALVVLDGVSLRELPILTKLAVATNYKIVEKSYRYSALPSDTESFIEQRLLGKRISPSQLESRKELSAIHVRAFYYDTPIRYFDLSSNGSSFLLWSSFPDGTYMNFEARNSLHFETLVKQFDVIWKNIILAVPKDYRVVITSDHGYIYLNTGYESSEKAESALQFLEQNRYKIVEPLTQIPELSELQIVSDINLAMIRGRIKNRPKGSSSNKVFRHGGLSLMEMITPFLVLERN
ncbi:MAG: hypothetical protein Q8N03_08645 [Ignavibacteria bacterium]|jgi:hypothetical protein|nr:hypothetical protein [Ignavibacteria bacterium]